MRYLDVPVSAVVAAVVDAAACLLLSELLQARYIYCLSIIRTGFYKMGFLKALG